MFVRSCKICSNNNSYNRLNKPKYEQLGQFEELIFNCFKKGVFGGPVDKKIKREEDSI